MTTETMVRWFWWANWSTEKFEQWLEEKAAQGWHLVKADRLLLRCHFRRSEPKKVRYCVDYPGEITDEYYTIFEDAGWELAASGLGWYVWRYEYTGERRPELFNDVQPLIERNNRLLLILGLALLSQVGVLVSGALARLSGTAVGRALLVPYIAVILIIVAAAAVTYRHNKQLKSRNL